MSHLVGEPVTIRTQGEDEYDRYGDLIPGAVVDTVIPGAVVIPQVSESIDGTGVIDGEANEVTVLLPRFVEVAQGATLIIRDEEWKVERTPFHHRSVYGSKLGGTELYVRRVNA